MERLAARSAESRAGSSPPARSSGAGSSATSTTARSSASSSLRIRLAIASEQVDGRSRQGVTLGELEHDLDEAIEELRDLAHGIFPSVLADRGLVPALRAVGRRGPRAVQVTGRRVGRYPPEIESAVYYCCLEALQNATKHAGPAAHIVARLDAEKDELRLEVSDDGPGSTSPPLMPASACATWRIAWARCTGGS